MRFFGSPFSRTKKDIPLSKVPCRIFEIELTDVLLLLAALDVVVHPRLERRHSKASTANKAFNFFIFFLTFCLMFIQYYNLISIFCKQIETDC
jgi:hypothetical protein